MLRMLPILYLSFIGLQSRFFDPIIFEDFPRLGYFFEQSHLVMFGILYVLIIMALTTYGKLTIKKELTAVFICIFFAFGDEIHQYYVPERSASWNDIYKNATGIILAWFIVYTVGKLSGWRK